MAIDARADKLLGIPEGSRTDQVIDSIVENAGRVIIAIADNV
jgi:hypothetical protein